MISVGVDVGGTFTDCVAIADGKAVTTKIPSTPKDPSIAVMEGIRSLLKKLDRPSSDLTRLFHGTTVVINAALQRRGIKLGFITTRGFEDTIEIGRMQRADVFDLTMDAETPVFLVPKRLRLGVDERLNAQGEVIKALDEDRVREAAKILVEVHEVQAIVVGFLFSFINAKHEQRAKEIIEELYPEKLVVLSSEVDPTFREYERFTTTLFDAYLRPVAARYIENLANEVEAINPACRLMIMKSSGGLCAPSRAAERPLVMLKSGLAGGVKGACEVAKAAGFQDIISVDIGGTSCDVSLVRGGVPVIRSENYLDTYPIRSPMVDISTIGAGGGSIAWIDTAGSLHVGPQSAGAEPGPACYGRGGDDVTITDASLYLGYLRPDGFAGGLTLDRQRSVDVIERLAKKLGISSDAAAWGVHRILNEKMADEIRKVSINRGLDARKFALVALGGGGPVHACELARIMKMSEILVPEYPGLLAACGLLAAHVTHEESISLHVEATPDSKGVIQTAADSVQQKAVEKLVSDGAPQSELETEFVADLRYEGQAFQIGIGFSRDQTELTRKLVEGFHSEHKRLYGVENRTRKVEIVAVRAVCVWLQKNAQVNGDHKRGLQKIEKKRIAYDSGSHEFRDFSVYWRNDLPLGASISGPAIVEQADTTTVIPSYATAIMRDDGNLLLKI